MGFDFRQLGCVIEVSVHACWRGREAGRLRHGRRAARRWLGHFRAGRGRGCPHKAGKQHGAEQAKPGQFGNLERGQRSANAARKRELGQGQGVAGRIKAERSDEDALDLGPWGAQITAHLTVNHHQDRAVDTAGDGDANLSQPR